MKYVNRADQDFQTRILLAEDEAPVRLVMWHILNRAGYTVFLATDGFDGLRKLSETGHIDLLITDLSMPGMTGIQLARHACEIVPSLKVIYASGSRDCFLKPALTSDVLRSRSRLMNCSGPFEKQSAQSFVHHQRLRGL